MIWLTVWGRSFCGRLAPRQARHRRRTEQNCLFMETWEVEEGNCTRKQWARGLVIQDPASVMEPGTLRSMLH